MNPQQKAQLLEAWQAHPERQETRVESREPEENFPAPPLAVPPSPAAAPIDIAYQQAKETPSDVNEHVQRLAGFARGKESVCAIAAKIDAALTGLLFGRPQHLYVISPANSVHLLQLQAPVEIHGLPADADPVPVCEAVYIDGEHTAAAVRRQLDLFVGSETNEIALHDTETFGISGEDGGDGILKAIAEWLEDHPEWIAAEHEKKNNGLTILRRWNPQVDESRGLGDSVAKLTHATGLDKAASKLAALIGLDDCGCQGRQNRFNAWFPYWKPKEKPES